MATQNIWNIYDNCFLENDSMIILFFIGLFSGIISGMGIGGGTILIPALTIFFGFEQKIAQNINLIYFLPTALIAIFTHSKDGNIEKRGLFKIITFGVIGAIIGAILANKMNSDTLKKFFGWFLLLMGISELLKKKGR